MPYIPEKHMQYNLLVNSSRRGCEVFSYPCNLLDEVNKILHKGESLYSIYEGVIDEEEFTSYVYSTAAELWEIIDDLTGMAYDTIYSNGIAKKIIN